MATNGQGLEFKLGEETYCVSIDCVTEIVDVDESPAKDGRAIHGVIKQESGAFVIWVDPKAVHAA